jgi:deoxyhypusine synthase
MSVPESVTGAVLVASDTLPEGTPVIRGYDFNRGVNHDELLNSLLLSGFQATNFGKAVQEVNNTNVYEYVPCGVKRVVFL